jgi:hypothetical protein
MKPTVDHGCPDILMNVCNVYQDSNGCYYSCSLTMIDIETNTNRCFVMQILDRNHEAYFFYTRSGRIGTFSNQNIECSLEVKPFIEKFCAVFAEKTGRAWCDRNTTYDIKPGFYNYVGGNVTETSIDDEEDKIEADITNLLSYLYDRQHYYNMAKNYDLDVGRFPLGSIKIDQLFIAEKILDDLVKCYNNDPPQTRDLSNKFYALIPTSKRKLTSIDNLEEISKLQQLLSSLKDICCVIDGLSLSSRKKLNSLNSRINRIAKGTTSWNLLETFLCNKGKHNMMYRLNDAYSVERFPEDISYLPWEQYNNRYLLFHGTQPANLVSIITHGLSINPSSAVKITGAMFGNGIYFADVASKSLQYCGNDDVVPLLVCEVALGNMLKAKKGKDYNVQTLTAGYDSVKGLGKHCLSELKSLDDGVIMPSGKLIKSDVVDGSLIYNEYIVYRQSQVRLRYLLLIKMIKTGYDY